MIEQPKAWVMWLGLMGWFAVSVLVFVSAQADPVAEAQALIARVTVDRGTPIALANIICSSTAPALVPASPPYTINDRVAWLVGSVTCLTPLTAGMVTQFNQTGTHEITVTVNRPGETSSATSVPFTFLGSPAVPVPLVVPTNLRVLR